MIVAAHMCYTLGFHKDKALIPETHEQRRRRVKLVWLAVMGDKVLSLRLGRPSTFQESHLTLERIEDTEANPTGLAAMPKWIEWSLHQGRIYDLLFSPDALRQPVEMRVDSAKMLAEQLQVIFDSTSASEVCSR